MNVSHAAQDLVALVRPLNVTLALAMLPGLARSPRALSLGLAGALVALFFLAVVTAVVPNPLFIRMTPVRPLDYVFLTISVLLAGILAGSYALPSPDLSGDRGMFGGVLSFLAIGCPICNKIVVGLLGAAGALTYFEPIQPLLGGAGVALLALGVVARLSGAAQCRLTQAPRVSA